MPPYRVLMALPYDSGLPEDVVVNSWYCTADDDTAAEAFAVALIAFYGAVDGLFSSLLNNSTDACTGKIYDMFDDEPRVPTSVFHFTVADATGSPLPPEAAICLSYQAAATSGVTQRRRRGRVYLGPLDTSCVASTGYIDATVQDIVRDAGQALLDASDASATWTWVVHSRENDNYIGITNGWVDNEFDTQRRRGRVATTRLTFS